MLMLVPGLAAERGLMLATATATATAIASVRDLVNTLAEHMGPAELAQAVKLVAEQHGATFKQTVATRCSRGSRPSTPSAEPPSVRRV